MAPPEDTPPSDDLFAALYDELRQLADNRLSRERADHSLRPTELVHEVYYRLSRSPNLVITGTTSAK